MNIRSKLRNLVEDLLVKHPTNGSYQARVVNRALVKHVTIHDSLPEVLRASHRGNIRILASDAENSRQIADRLKQNIDECGIESIETTEKAIDCPRFSGLAPIHKSSVVVQLAYEPLLESTLQDLEEPSFLSNLRKSVLGPTHYSEKVVIDFSSPNIAKPFHFGHMKSTILGNFLSNLNEFLGNKVTRLNYIGDWGTQYGLINLGLDRFGQEGIEKHESHLRYLLDVYIKASELGNQDKSFYNEAKEKFLQMFKENDEIGIARWKRIRDASLVELNKSYSVLGLKFDVYEFESDYVQKSIQLIDSMKDLNFIRQLEDGAIVAEVEKNNLFIEIPLIRSDGASLYIARDLAASINRKNEYDFDKMLYIVGAEQERHFHCLKQLIKRLGYNWYNSLTHVRTGKVISMSTRSGNFVLLSDIIDEVTQRYIQTTRDTITTKVSCEVDVEEVGKQLALSALFIFDMRNRRGMSYEFNWDLVVKVSDRSGINLQTSFARLSSLLEKADANGIKFEQSDKLNNDSICCREGLNLLSMFNELDTALHHSYWSNDASPLVNHALLLSKVANRARRSEHLKVVGEPDIKKAKVRLRMFQVAHMQLAFIIKLLGLKPLYKV